MITKLEDLCDGVFNGKIIAMLGVTFKPDTDDMRDAPALTIVPALVGGGAKVRVCDPQGQHEGEALLPGVNWVEDPYKARKTRIWWLSDRMERVPRAGSKEARQQNGRAAYGRPAQRVFRQRRQTRRVRGL